MQSGNGSKGSVLVIEDDQTVALVIRFVLEREGFEVHWAADGRAAVECMARLAPPALVTVDFMLPHLRGSELIVHMRATPGWEQVPIVMISATPRDEVSGWAVESGADVYLSKPFRPDELRSVARRLTLARGGIS